MKYQKILVSLYLIILIIVLQVMNIQLEKAQEKSIGVYQIKNNITNKVYIGSTISGFKKRLSEHLYELNLNRHHSQHLQKSFNRYGSQNFDFSVLEICKRENIIIREQFWLDSLKSYKRKHGYNILSKAYNSLGYKHTEENLILIGQMSKLRGSHPNSIKAMQLANLGSKKDQAHSDRMSLIHSKAIIQLDLQGNFIQEFESIIKAKISLGINPIDSNISKCANGKCKSYKGFMWIKKKDYNPNIQYKYEPIINGVI